MSAMIACMSEKQSFRDRMLFALDATGMSIAELARRSGVSYDAINKVKRRDGASTSAENASAIARVLGFDWDGADPLPTSSDIDLVKVFDVHASAGDGMFALTEDHASSLAFPKGYLQWLTRANPRDLAIIGVKGDSMLPTLADDDIVMLDTSKTDLSYDGLFVIRDNGDALLVKRVGRASKPGHVTIISDNRALYDPVEKSLSDIHVIGKVIWSGGKV